MDHFTNFLEKADTSKIQIEMDALSTHRAALEAAVARYIHTGIDRTTADGALENAQSISNKAWMTKTEIKCCRALLKASDKKKRLQNYTGLYTTNTKRDWREDMHELLVAEVDQFL